MSVRWLVALAACVAVCVGAERGGSSLRSALEALQRRQRSPMHPPLNPMPEYDNYEYIPHDYTDPDYDISEEDEDPNPEYVFKLLGNNPNAGPDYYKYTVVKKNDFRPEANANKKESAFRERSHHSDNERLRDLFVEKTEAEEKKEFIDKAKNEAEYALLLGQLWSKYKYDKAKSKDMESAPPGVIKLYKEKIVKKRYPDNWGPIAFKRKRSSDPDVNRPPSPDYDADRKHEDNAESNYNNYELTDDDKDDLREEYAIAFQPLDDDSLSDMADEDQYTYDAIEKRFPVTKRSSGAYNFSTQKKRFAINQNKRETPKSFRSSSGTDPKIIRDLSKIFGDTESLVIKNPVKRSSDHEENMHDTKAPLVPIVHQNTTHEHHNVTNHDDDSHEHHGHNMHHPGMVGKTEDHHHDHNENEKPLIIKKKSIDWSDYFGIDKRKKNQKKFVNDLTQDRLRKQYFDTFNKEVIYPLSTFQKHTNVKRNFVQASPNEETEIQIDRAQAIAVRNDDKRTQSENDAKLDNIDKKLKTMEGLIVDEALHYSNVGEDLDSKEEQEMKEKLLSRLAAAYSLEKMRKALKEFKQSLQTQKPESILAPSPIPTDETKSKRVAVKKEKVEITGNEIPTYNKDDERNDDFEGEQGAGHYLNGKIEEQFSEGYMGSGRHRTPVISTVGTGSCPVLAKIVQRCRGVDLLAGDRGQLFLPLCSLHQICYLCGEAPPTTCDLVFLSEADTTCEGDMGCQRAARSALMALRELHDNLADELDGECEASPCLPATLKLNIGWQRALQR